MLLTFHDFIWFPIKGFYLIIFTRPVYVFMKNIRQNNVSVTIINYKCHQMFQPFFRIILPDIIGAPPPSPQILSHHYLSDFK